MSHRVHCCGSCVVSLCSQWREQAFRYGSSVCHRNPSGYLPQGACFSLLPTESMNMSHVNPIHYMCSTFTAVVVWLFGTLSLSGSSLWHWGSLLSDRRAPAHSPLSSPGPLLLCDELTIAVLGPGLLHCSNAGYLPSGFPWGHSHSLLNSLLVVHQGSNSIIISGGVVGYILAILRDQMYPSSTA